MLQTLRTREKLFKDTPMTNRKIQVNDYPRINPNINLVSRELTNYTTSRIRKENQNVYTNPIWGKLSFFSKLDEKIDESNLLSENKLTFIKLWGKIQDKYILNDSLEIFKYLYGKRNIADFLLLAARNIAEVFANEKLELKFLYDPEIVGWKQLIIAIHTDLDASEAFNKLKLLDRNWWLDASDIIGNDLEIHIDFDEI